MPPYLNTTLFLFRFQLGLQHQMLGFSQEASLAAPSQTQPPAQQPPGAIIIYYLVIIIYSYINIII